MISHKRIWALVFAMGFCLGINQAQSEWWEFWKKNPREKKVEQKKVIKKQQKLQFRAPLKQKTGTSTDPAQKLLDEGDAYSAQGTTYGTLTKAIAKYQELVDKYPNSPLVFTALTRIGSCYLTLGEYIERKEKKKWYKRNIEVCKDIIKRYPTGTQSLDFYFFIGLGSFEIQEYETATIWLLKSIEKHKEYGLSHIESYIESYYVLSNCYIEQEKYKEAIDILQYLIKTFPNSFPVKSYTCQYAIGFCYEGLERYNEAIEIFKNTLEKGDKIVFNVPEIITFRIGELYEKKGDYKQAKIWYQKVIDTYPNHPIVENAQEKLEELADKQKKK